MFEFKLPDLGEGIHEGELLIWHVKQGDDIKEDDPLCDMETDKATVTIPSPRTGKIVKLNGNPGDTIHVGEVLVVIESEEGSKEASRNETTPAPKETPATPLELKSAEPEKTSHPSRPSKMVAAAPATRRLARELHMDITKIEGTGAGGRITPEDVKKAAQSENGTNDQAGNQTAPAPQDVEPAEQGKAGEPAFVSGNIPFLDDSPLPDFSKSGPIEVFPIRSLRKKVAVKTTTSAILIPHVAHMEEWDVTAFESLRKKLKETQKENLTLLSFVVKAAATLLGAYPQFNASVDAKKLQIIHKKYFHIGFAADTPKGLMVPNVKHADTKSVSKIAKDIRTLAEKGREGTIEAEDLSGSTFTVTNVGVIGGTGVFPIINFPESAILGLGRVMEKPVVKDGQIVIRKMLPATLCFDHRVADGVQAAKFMRDLKTVMEDPQLFLTRI